MKILLCINTLTTIDAQVYSNHFAWAYHLGRESISKGIEIIFYTPWRTSIDRARNNAAKVALEHECDYLMFVDDDMLIQLDTLEKLLAADKDIVMAHTYIRGYPFKPMCFKNTGEPGDIILKHFDDFANYKDENGLVECTAIGFACVLIKMHLIQKMEPPYFVTTPNSTEDVYFCLRCKMEIDSNTSIFMDTRVPTGHAMDKEFVHERTVENLRKYYELFTPKENDTRGGDRGTEYHKKIEVL